MGKESLELAGQKPLVTDHKFFPSLTLGVPISTCFTCSGSISDHVRCTTILDKVRSYAEREKARDTIASAHGFLSSREWQEINARRVHLGLEPIPGVP